MNFRLVTKSVTLNDIPFVVGAISVSQKALTLCGWGVKAGWFVCGWPVKLCDPLVTHGP